MTAKEKRYPTPEFRSLQEEEEYWKTHSPIAEGYEGEVKRPRHRRSSFLALRLSGEELDGLRQLAAKRGVGPSTLARIIITSAIDQGDTTRRQITLDEFAGAMQQAMEGSLPQPVKGKAMAGGAAVKEPGSPYLSIVDSSQRRQIEEVTGNFFMALLATLGVEVVPPQSDGNEKAERSVPIQKAARKTAAGVAGKRQ
jgi:hypothetical protein